MKKIFLIPLLFIFLSIFSCSKIPENNERHSVNSSIDSMFPEEFLAFQPSNICFLEISNKVENLKVRIAVRDYWLSDSVLSGDAEIFFYENDSIPVLNFKAPYFGMKGIAVDSITNRQVVRVAYEMPKLDFSKPIAFEKFSDLPFFFLDVNFDGKKDLIITYFRQGQRRSNAYQAFHIIDEISGGYGYDYLYDCLRGVAPYQDLDDLSEIDFTKKEISTFDYAGYSDSQKEIYKPINNQITLRTIETYDSLGWLLARRQVLKTDTITTYHNNREHLFK